MLDPNIGDTVNAANVEVETNALKINAVETIAALGNGFIVDEKVVLWLGTNT